MAGWSIHSRRGEAPLRYGSWRGSSRGSSWA